MNLIFQWIFNLNFKYCLCIIFVYNRKYIDAIIIKTLFCWLSNIWYFEVYLLCFMVSCQYPACVLSIPILLHWSVICQATLVCLAVLLAWFSHCLSCLCLPGQNSPHLATLSTEYLSLYRWVSAKSVLAMETHLSCTDPLIYAEYFNKHKNELWPKDFPDKGSVTQSNFVPLFQHRGSFYGLYSCILQ